MSVQLAVAPIAWSNSDLPQLGGDTPLETCLRAVSYTHLTLPTIYSV